MDWTQRTELLIGKEGLEKLKNSSVLIVGLGGVGGMAAEMICRAGVGKMTIIDRDTVSETNINRQIIALHSTVNQLKTEIFVKRLSDINPELELNVISDWLDENNTEQILNDGKFDFVVDAIDTLSPKVFLIKTCVEKGIKVVSSMGSGAKMDTSKVKVADISKTNYCPLAKAVRQRLAKIGIKKGVAVVYSDETAKKESVIETDEKYKKSTTGTISYMPALFGLHIAAYVINQLIENNIE
ncbi:tRNA threonylcarbamoyladenosine dehydratase [uncultured Paludibacter sp.]|uniref:tRNA threonylcarbamoyladenosine dehydratase n=1 Tax=uncultured Paludibacter sp. TaxID=497635 RepID=A0A653AGV8_9BACT|nr:tRNA threonylcarbamoyladenosine dehydratase [uncultured Paludibacter sp.]